MTACRPLAQALLVVLIRTIRVMPAALDREGEFLLPEGIVPFPRGFGFGRDGRIYLSSGVAPIGQGDNTIVVFDRGGTLLTPRLVTDPKLSPLDLKLAPNGNIVVASEWPFGAPDAVPSVREYDPLTGQLVRVFAPERSVGFRRPRGLRFGPDGRLYCVGKDHVVAFDFRTGSFAGPAVHLERLNGQALVLGALAELPALVVPGNPGLPVPAGQHGTGAFTQSAGSSSRSRVTYPSRRANTAGASTGPARALHRRHVSPAARARRITVCAIGLVRIRSRLELFWQVRW